MDKSRPNDKISENLKNVYRPNAIMVLQIIFLIYVVSSCLFAYVQYQFR